MQLYNPNYLSRHLLEMQVRRSKPAPVPEPEEPEVVEYFDVDKEMKYYRSDTPNSVRTGGKKADLSAHNKVGRGPYKKGPTASKEIIQIDLDGHFVDTHSSISAAAKALNADVSSIRKCAMGDKKYGQVAGFKWAYAGKTEEQ